MDEKPIRMTVAAWQDITKRIRRVSEELRELHLLLQDETKLIIEEPMPQEEVEKYKKATQAEYTAAISRHLMKKDRKWTPKS